MWKSPSGSAVPALGVSAPQLGPNASLPTSLNVPLGKCVVHSTYCCPHFVLLDSGT